MKAFRVVNSGILVLLVVFYSCEKPDDTFFVGKKGGKVHITKFDPFIVINTDTNVQGYLLDLDNDGLHDLFLHGQEVVSASGAWIKRARLVLTDSSFRISTFERADTFFRCWCDNNSCNTVFNNQSAFTCGENENLSVYLIQTNEFPLVHSEGDQITGNELWSAGSSILCSYDHSRLIIYDPFLYTDILQGQWLDKEMKYVLFKKLKATGDLYGWIMISVSNFNEIRLHEYAIQKE